MFNKVNNNTNITPSNFKFVNNWFQNASYLTIAIDCNLALNSMDYEVAIEKRNIRIKEQQQNLLKRLFPCFEKRAKFRNIRRRSKNFQEVSNSVTIVVRVNKSF
jgi:hypothetical protein